MSKRITVTDAEFRKIKKERKKLKEAEKQVEKWLAEEKKQAECKHYNTVHSRGNHDSMRDDAWCFIDCRDCGKRLRSCGL